MKRIEEVKEYLKVEKLKAKKVADRICGDAAAYYIGRKDLAADLLTYIDSTENENG
jgi:hypothetical protein